MQSTRVVARLDVHLAQTFIERVAEHFEVL